MCGILDTELQDSILQAAVEDIAYVAEDDALEDGWRFRIFGSKEFQYAISMKVRPKPCSFEI